jgi:predicted RecB family nuclease
MGIRKIPMLSKSRFLAGLQCPLRLWHECYNWELASKVSPAQQAVFNTGHEVGQLATRLYPGGVLIKEDYLHHKEAVQATLKAMGNPNVRAIYEAGFIRDGVRVRVDILERLDHGKWNLIEVKSSTSEKDIHLPDVAVQYHVLEGSGLDIEQVILIHVNSQYVYDGENLDLGQLFSRTDMTRKALMYQNQIPSLLSGFKDMLAKPEQPEIRPGRHCKNPYECEFWEHCTKGMPEHWVMDLSGITQVKLNELAAMGIEKISDIPPSFSLSALQERIRSCVIRNKDCVSPKLKDELMNVQFPIHFLDFETTGTAVPRYKGTRPYQSIPFQWSDHILCRDGTIHHLEYLCDEDKDPREEFSLSLLDALGEGGSIVTYTSYEEEIVKALAEKFLKHKEKLLALLTRVKDLHKIISRHYYHPGFHGSFSLKSVLPAILPEMSYENLAIQEGQLAGLEYLRMIDPATSSDEKERIRNDLLIYCGHDTFAMLKIREELLKGMDCQIKR